MTHKVWAQVEVEDERPGNEQPRLVGGVDVEKAREALLELRQFRPDYGPSELFNTNNPMYSAPRSLETIIREDFDRDPIEVAELVRESAYERIEARSQTLPEADNAKQRKATIEKTIAKALISAPPELGLSMFAAELDTDEDTLRSYGAGDNQAPFFSEAYLYTLVGKDIARSILGLLRQLRAALGDLADE